MKHNSLLKANLSYWLVLILAWLMFVVICSPLRETVIDDDFATLREAQNYLSSGSYVPSQWTAPFTFPQILYGTKVAESLIGLISLPAALRLSNLPFSLLGIISLFIILQQHTISKKASLICCFQLIASSIYMYLSYLFYSDIPALATGLLSIALYNYGLSGNRRLAFLFASLSASASILFRQTGIAIFIALILFMLFKKEKGKAALAITASLILPIACIFYVFSHQANPVTFAAITHNALQAEYLRSPIAIAVEFIKRLSLLTIVIVTLSAPLSFFVTWCVFRDIRDDQVMSTKTRFFEGQTQLSSSHHLFQLTLCILFVISILVSRLIQGEPIWLPYLPWYYSYEFIPKAISNPLFSVWVLLSSVLVLYIFSLFFSEKLTTVTHPKAGQNIVSASMQIFGKLTLFDWFAVSNLILLLAIFKVGDKYFIVLIPWFLVFIGRYFQCFIEKYFLLILMIMSLVTIGNAAILDKSYAVMEAEFRAVSHLQDLGVTDDNIWYSMASYTNFNDYVEEVGMMPPQIEKGIYYDFFNRWAPGRARQAQYHVVRLGEREDQWTMVSGEIINEIEVQHWGRSTTKVLTVRVLP